jgi:ABC-type ATPase involved in cell division
MNETTALDLVGIMRTMNESIATINESVKSLIEIVRLHDRMIDTLREQLEGGET